MNQQLTFVILPLDCIAHILQYDTTFPLCLYSLQSINSCPFITRFVFRRQQESRKLYQSRVISSQFLFKDSHNQLVLLDSKYPCKIHYTHIECHQAMYSISPNDTLNWHNVFYAPIHTFISNSVVRGGVANFQKIAQRRDPQLETQFYYHFYNTQDLSIVHSLISTNPSPNFTYFLLYHYMSGSILDVLKEVAILRPLGSKIYAVLDLNLRFQTMFQKQSEVSSINCTSVDHVRLTVDSWADIHLLHSIAIPPCKILSVQAHSSNLHHCTFPLQEPELIVVESQVNDVYQAMQLILYCVQCKIFKLAFMNVANWSETTTIQEYEMVDEFDVAETVFDLFVCVEREKKIEMENRLYGLHCVIPNVNIVYMTDPKAFNLNNCLALLAK